MAETSGPNLGLVHGWEDGASGWGPGLNGNLRRLDCLTQLAVLDRNLAAPPASPVDGARYIVASGASGEWAGQEGRIACFAGGGWEFYAPGPGWRCAVPGEDLLVWWSGSTWQELGRGGDAVAFSAYKGGTDQSVTKGEWTKVTFENERFSSGGRYASDRFTPGLAGRYHVAATVSISNALLYCAVFKNGSVVTASAGYGSANASTVLELDSDDFVEAYVFATTDAPVVIGTSLAGMPLTAFHGHRLGG